MKDPEMETLAEQLGTTAHISPLLMKARRVGLAEPEDLEGLAIARGCRYYDPAIDKSLTTQKEQTISKQEFSNAELALALLSVSLPKSQRRLRVGAAMLAAEGNRPEDIVRLARLERCESVVRHVAKCGAQVEPDKLFWTSILDDLPKADAKPWVLPHITRFVAMTGVTRRGTETVMQWIRPTGELAA
jgi:hypothetical protein